MISERKWWAENYFNFKATYNNISYQGQSDVLYSYIILYSILDTKSHQRLQVEFAVLFIIKSHIGFIATAITKFKDSFNWSGWFKGKLCINILLIDKNISVLHFDIRAVSKWKNCCYRNFNAVAFSGLANYLQSCPQVGKVLSETTGSINLWPPQRKWHRWTKKMDTHIALSCTKPQ